MLVSNDKALTDNRAVGIEGVGGDLGAIASLDFDRSQLALCQPGEGGGADYTCPTRIFTLCIVWPCSLHTVV